MRIRVFTTTHNRQPYDTLVTTVRHHLNPPRRCRSVFTPPSFPPRRCSCSSSLLHHAFRFDLLTVRRPVRVLYPRRSAAVRATRSHERQEEGERTARAFRAGGGQHPLAMEDDHSGLVRNHLSLSNDGPQNVSSIKAADRTVCLTSLMNAESALTPGAEALIRLVGLRHAQEKDEQYVRERIVQARLRE